MMGIVYHANYLLYFEDARTRFLEAIGFPYDHIEQAGYLSPVTHFECDYGAPLRYGDTAVVRTRVVSSRPTKTVYAYGCSGKARISTSRSPAARDGAPIASLMLKRSSRSV